MELLRQTLIGSAVGVVGTGLGGCVCYFFRPGEKSLAFMMAFAAGIMSAVAAFELIPRSFGSANVFAGLASIFAGMIFVYIISTFFKPGETSSLIRAGIITGLTIAVHNFPEGLAIGSGFSAGEGIGAGIALVILLHDMPEGMAMAAPLRASGMGARVIWLTLLAGAPTGVGALTGYVLGNISLFFYSVCMGFAGGAMLHATVAELIPESLKSGGTPLTIAGMAVGIATGAAAVFLV